MTRLSSRQYQLAMALSELRRASKPHAAQWNQTTFNSFARRGYVRADGDGFAPTKALHAALAEFRTAEIHRRFARVDLGKWAQEMLDRRKKPGSIHQVA